jgi:hypothetical protein
MGLVHREFWKRAGARALAVLALAVFCCRATPVQASPRTQGGTDLVEQTATQPPPAPQAPSARRARDEARGVLGMVGWTYSSIIRNGVVANLNLSRAKKVENEDASEWRGLQLTGTVGRRGFEAGAGYARMTIAAQFPIGYEFRGLAGRTWMASGNLAAGDVYAGGEATLMFAILRFTAGAIVPITGDASRHPVLTGSVGVVLFLTKWKKVEIKTAAAPGK